MAATCIVGSICVISASCLICLAAYELSPVILRMTEGMSESGEYGDRKGDMGHSGEDDEYKYSNEHEYGKDVGPKKKNKKKDLFKKKKNRPKCEVHQRRDTDANEYGFEHMSMTELEPIREERNSRELERMEERDRRASKDLEIMEERERRPSRHPERIEERDRRTSRDPQIMDEKDRKSIKKQQKLEEKQRRHSEANKKKKEKSNQKQRRKSNLF